MARRAQSGHDKAMGDASRPLRSPARASLPAGAAVPLLHGASGFWDDLIALLGIVAVIGVLIFLSWRSGTKKRAARGRGRRSRR